MIEQRPGSAALRRAWDLARKRFWWMVGFMLLLTLFSLLVIQGPTSIVTSIFQARMRSAANLGGEFTMQLIVQSLTALVFSLLYQPLQLACATLAYFDLRVRLEGFDLALMANQANAQPIDALDLAGQQAPAPAQDSLITWTEIGYFAAMSLIGVVLYLLIIGVLGVMSLMIQGLF